MCKFLLKFQLDKTHNCAAPAPFPAGGSGARGGSDLKRGCKQRKFLGTLSFASYLIESSKETPTLAFCFAYFVFMTIF